MVNSPYLVDKLADFRKILPNANRYIKIYYSQSVNPFFRWENNRPTFYIPDERVNFIWHELGHFLFTNTPQAKNYGLADCTEIEIIEQETLAFHFEVLVHKHFFNREINSVNLRLGDSWKEILVDYRVTDRILDLLDISCYEEINSEFASAIYKKLCSIAEPHSK